MGLSVRMVASDTAGHGEFRFEGGGKDFSRMIVGGRIAGFWFGLRTAERWRMKSRTLQLARLKKPTNGVRMRSIFDQIHIDTGALVLLAMWMLALLKTAHIAHAETEANIEYPKPSLSVKMVDTMWTGRVGALNDDGIIVLDNGRGFRQWAIEFTDISAARAFLVGREIFCREVISTLTSYDLVNFVGYVGVYDCEVLSKKPDAPQTQRNYLSLYPWAADLGFAQLGCNDVDKMPEGVFSVLHADGYSYSCSGAVSARQTPVP